MQYLARLLNQRANSIIARRNMRSSSQEEILLYAALEIISDSINLTGSVTHQEDHSHLSFRDCSQEMQSQYTQDEVEEIITRHLLEIVDKIKD